MATLLLLVRFNVVRTLLLHNCFLRTVSTPPNFFTAASNNWGWISTPPIDIFRFFLLDLPRLANLPMAALRRMIVAWFWSKPRKYLYLSLAFLTSRSPYTKKLISRHLPTLTSPARPYSFSSLTAFKSLISSSSFFLLLLVPPVPLLPMITVYRT